MAFKSVEEFNEDRYHGKFRLVNNKDNAYVIFLYRNKRDELEADAHYINSADYSGYVHCLGKGCPACAKGLRVQKKIFVPLYNIKQNDVAQDRIEFWDRNITFDRQLDQDVFNNYPNPSACIFRITRNGEAGDKDTKYTIQATNNNNLCSYDDILAKFNAKMPDYYSEVIREFSAAELAEMLQNTSGSSSNADLPDFTPIPRAGYQSSIPNTFVSASDAVTVNPNDTSVDDILISNDDVDNEDFPTPDF